MKDSMGDRMKGYYENATRYFIPRRSNIIIRVDGKAFHTFTKKMVRPFDDGLIEDMNNTAIELCKNIQGAKFAYVQSDEISIYVSDKDTLETSAWFDNNLQKMCSVSASIATSSFNYFRMLRYFNSVNQKTENTNNNYDITSKFGNDIDFTTKNITVGEIEQYLPDKKLVATNFDSRVFCIPEEEEVVNYFIWRQRDATKNSISSVAQSLYPHKELEGKTSDDKQEMIFQKGINWNNYDFRKKRGALITKVDTIKKISYNGTESEKLVKQWEVVETPIFDKDRDFLKRLINPA